MRIGMTIITVGLLSIAVVQSVHAVEPTIENIIVGDGEGVITPLLNDILDVDLSFETSHPWGLEEYIQRVEYTIYAPDGAPFQSGILDQGTVNPSWFFLDSFSFNSWDPHGEYVLETLLMVNTSLSSSCKSLDRYIAIAIAAVTSPLICKSLSFSITLPDLVSFLLVL